MASGGARQNDEDVFTLTWGCSTKWKTGIPANMRSSLKDEMCLTQALASCKPPDKPPLKPQDLDKPLPRLPDLSNTLSAITKQASGSTASDVEASRTSISTIGSVFRLARRKAIFYRRKKPNPVGPNQYEPAAMPSDMTTVPHRSYVDQGTQTTENLMAMKRWRHFISFTPSSNSQGTPIPLLLSDPSSSHWSPRRFLPATGATDYFTAKFPSRPVVSKSASSQDFTPKSRGSNENSDFGDSEASVTPNSLQTRPIIARNANSEPISTTAEGILDKKSAILKAQNSVERTDAHLRFDHSARGDTLMRPMPFPFQKYPSFVGRDRSTTRQRSSSGSSSGSRTSPHRRANSNKQHMSKSSSHYSSQYNSSLRREFLLERTPPLVMAAEPADYFRVRQDGPSPAVTPPESHIPDHLPTSPLCPRNPKHPSNGKGKCPMHGKNPSESDDDLDIFQAETSRNRREEDSRRYKLPAGFHDGPAFFAVEMPNHSADSPECPANRNSQSICLYHERWLKCDSIESIPRWRLL